MLRQLPDHDGSGKQPYETHHLQMETSGGLVLDEQAHLAIGSLAGDYFVG